MEKIKPISHLKVANNRIKFKSQFLTCSIILTQRFPAVHQKEVILFPQPLIINNPFSYSFMIQNDPACTNKMLLCRSCQRIKST